MKLWQDPLNKTPSKGGNEVQKKKTQLQTKKANPKWDTKGKRTNYVLEPHQ